MYIFAILYQNVYHTLLIWLIDWRFLSCILARDARMVHVFDARWRRRFLYSICSLVSQPSARARCRQHCSSLCWEAQTVGSFVLLICVMDDSNIDSHLILRGKNSCVNKALCVICGIWLHLGNLSPPLLMPHCPWSNQSPCQVYFWQQNQNQLRPWEKNHFIPIFPSRFFSKGIKCIE